MSVRSTPVPNPRPRPIPGRNTNSASTFSAPAKPSDASQALLWTLRNYPPALFQRSILNAILPNGSSSNPSNLVTFQDPRVVDQLYDCLSKLGVPMGASMVAIQEKQERHCIACHTNYFEKDNGLGSCALPHTSRYIEVVLPDESLEAYFPCCRLTSPIGEGQGLPDSCIDRRHTTNEGNLVTHYTYGMVTPCSLAGCWDDGESAEEEYQMSDEYQMTQPLSDSDESM